MNVTKIRRSKGFTLIELLVVVGIVAIALGIGLPNFQATIASSRLTSSANDMVVALQLARSESIKQVQFTGVIFNADRSSWDAVVFGTPNIELQRYTAASNVTLTVTSGDAFARYRSDGRLVTNAPIVMVFTVNGSDEKRQLTLQPSGFVSLVTP